MPRANSRDTFAPFRAEILSEALAICRARPAGDLRRPRIAHLRALVALSHDQLDLAIAYFTHAIHLSGTCPSLFADLGDAMLRKGRLADALSAHLLAVTLAPESADGYCKLGRVLVRQNRYAEANAVCREALRLAPDDVDVHIAIGEVLTTQRKVHAALEHFLKATTLAPQDVVSLLRLGEARLALGAWAEALATFRQALTLHAEECALHSGAGQALLRLGRLDEAAEAFYSALCVDPRDPRANHQYVLVMELQGRGSDSSSWISLGHALESKRRFDESAAAYGKAIARKPDSIRARTGLARTAIARGDAHTAARHLEAALAVDPEHAELHAELGLVLQQAGQFERSWDELAWYHHPSSSTWRHLEQPVWDGSPLAGRTVLLWSEEGTADDHTIHFLRYANYAMSSGGEVIVECPPSLVPVVGHADGPGHVVATGGPLPPYDLHAPLKHLPSLVKPARSIAHVAPFLAPPEALAATWRKRLAGSDAPLIGIAWAGSLDLGETPAPSLSLSAFAPLRHVEGMRFVSLQRGPHRDELLVRPAGFTVESCLPQSCTLAEVAAVLVNLDLVITVAGSLAHLAGALGTPVWTLLGQGVGWPWPIQGDKMPAYPTMRLFRQERAGSWEAVIEHVVTALTAMLHESRRALR